MEDRKIINTTGRNNCGGRCIIHAQVCNGIIEKLTTDTPQQAGKNVPLCACMHDRKCRYTGWMGKRSSRLWETCFACHATCSKSISI